MKKVILSIIIIILSLTMFYSFYNIIIWFIDNNETTELIENIKDEVYNNDINNNTDSEDKDLLKEKIDFKKLININNETVGWIEIKDTNINYPIVKHKDNDYYLNHSFDHTLNDAGWVFLDYRNDFSNLSKNNIIYAHGRVDGSMFGSLKDIYNKEYFESNNHDIYIYTPTDNYIFEVFSFYKVKATGDYVKTSFNGDRDFVDFINMLKGRSVYNFNVNISETDSIVTLSTCFNSREKLVLHAKKSSNG